MIIFNELPDERCERLQIAINNLTEQLDKLRKELVLAQLTSHIDSYRDDAFRWRNCAERLASALLDEIGDGSQSVKADGAIARFNELKKGTT